MHLYKAIIQTLLVLSILSPVFAAPMPRDTAAEEHVPGTTEASTSVRTLLAAGGVAPVSDSTQEPNPAVTHGKPKHRRGSFHFTFDRSAKANTIRVASLFTVAAAVTGIVELWKHRSKIFHREYDSEEK